MRKVIGIPEKDPIRKKDEIVHRIAIIFVFVGVFFFFIKLLFL